MVIVGTHIDKLRHFGSRTITSFTKLIKDLYSNTHEYPEIKAIKYVSCEDRYEYSIRDLRDTLYDIAADTKLSLSKLSSFSIKEYAILTCKQFDFAYKNLGCKRYEQRLINMMIPDKYLQLQEKIIAEASNFRLYKKKRGPPILSWKQILEYEYCALL